MESFSDQFSDLHSEALKRVYEILRDCPFKMATSFTDYRTDDGRQPDLYVMYEAANFGSHNVNVNLPIFAMRLAEDDKDKGELLQILVSHEEYKKHAGNLPSDFTDKYGHEYIWILYPDHYYSCIFEMADYLKRVVRF